MMIMYVHTILGQARFTSADYPAAVASFEQAEELSRGQASRPAGTIGSAYGLACRGALLGDQGDFGGAYVFFARALEAVEGADHEVEASVLTLHSAVCLWQGRWELGRKSAEDAKAIAERVKSLYVYSMACALAAFAEWRIEGDPESLHTIEDATHWLESHGKAAFTSLNYGWLMEGLLEAGREDEARKYFEGALARADKNELFGQAMAYRAMARMAAQRRDAQGVDEHLARAIEVADRRQSRHEAAVTLLARARCAATMGETDTAVSLAREVREAFRSMEMRWHDREAARLLETLS